MVTRLFYGQPSRLHVKKLHLIDFPPPLGAFLGGLRPEAQRPRWPALAQSGALGLCLRSLSVTPCPHRQVGRGGG